MIPSLFYERLERWNSPYINHFTSPDSIIPDVSKPQFFNRYSYAVNNPIRYNDPTGHCPVCIVSIAVADIALVAATVLFVATLLHPAVHDAMVENITKGINALDVKIRKP